MADSSRAHFRQAPSTDEHGGPGCPVMSPTDCPAATWGQTQIWPSSTRSTRARTCRIARAASAPRSACRSASAATRSGSCTRSAPTASRPTSHGRRKVELIARKVGERVGMLRAFKRSETQAHTDPLTGLMNRRSLEEKVRGLTENGSTYVAVVRAISTTSSSSTTSTATTPATRRCGSSPGCCATRVRPARPHRPLRRRGVRRRAPGLRGLRRLRRSSTGFASSSQSPRPARARRRSP